MTMRAGTSHARGALVDTEVNFWPAMIDMLTSLLMFFLLIHFVQNNVNPAGLAAEIARQKQQRFNELFDREFKADVARGDIQISSDVNLLQITFGEEILFPSGEYRLQDRGQAILRRLARVVHAVDESSATPLYDQLQIEGHTDSRRLERSSYPHDNWELSSARALDVLRFLTERTSPPLDKRTMSANGYADTRPRGHRSAANRRIEIRFYFSGREVLPSGHGATSR
jgi:chemotaxis protein MotB